MLMLLSSRKILRKYTNAPQKFQYWYMVMDYLIILFVVLTIRKRFGLYREE